MASDPDAEFLTRTGATSAPVDADAVFLTRTGAASIPTIVVKPDAADVPVDEYGRPIESAGRTVQRVAETVAAPGMAASKQPLAAVLASPEAQSADVPQTQPADNQTLGRVGGAIVRGYQHTPPLLSPEFQASVDQSGPVGRYITNPLYHMLGAVPAGINALGAGLGQLAYEAGAAVDPRLGRDLYMGLQVAPVAEMGRPVIRPDIGPGPAAPRFVSERYAPAPAPGATPLDRMNQLIAHDNAEVAGAGPQMQPNVLSAGSDGKPAALPSSGEAQSVGAAASRDGTPPGMIDLTKRQELVNRAQAETEKLNELQPRGPDLNRYVDGVDPTMAQMEQKAKTSREQKSLSTISSEITDQVRDVETAHIEARKAHFQQISGSKTEVDRLDRERSDQAKTDTAAAFRPGQVADAQPVVAEVNDILSAPRAKENTALKAYVSPLIDRLYESDGVTLKSNPEQLYGLREDINRMMSKPSQAKDQNLVHVSGELRQIRDVLDRVIEAGAPGYRVYMDNYANASRRIDELEVLQGHENGLNGFKTLVPFQGMMRKIVEAREKPGNNPYKSISDTTMQQLWALRDDLRRAASADDLAKARGSDTMQNAIDVAKTVAKTGVRAAMHYGLYHATGDLGANAVLGMADMLNNQRLQAKTVRRAHEMLNPNPLHYPPPNPGP